MIADPVPDAEVLSPTAVAGEPELLRDIHRIGGADLANLRLKAREAALPIPGISVLRASTPGEASRQIRVAFPRARLLHAAAQTVASTTEQLIRSVGFDIMHVPTVALPSHYRIIHPAGAVGFDDANLARLATVFVTTTGH